MSDRVVPIGIGFGRAVSHDFEAAVLLSYFDEEVQPFSSHRAGAELFAKQSIADFMGGPSRREIPGGKLMPGKLFL